MLKQTLKRHTLKKLVSYSTVIVILIFRKISSVSHQSLFFSCFRSKPSAGSLTWISALPRSSFRNPSPTQTPPWLSLTLVGCSFITHRVLYRKGFKVAHPKKMVSTSISITWSIGYYLHTGHLCVLIHDIIFYF